MSHDLHEWRRRRRRIRRLLKPLPRRANLRRYPLIRRFADMAARAPWLWSFQYGPVVRALYLGAILAFMPTYGVQVFIAFFVALFLRANLTLIIALQFVTNPLTLVPAYYLTDRVGMAVLKLLGITGAHGVLLTHTRALFVGGVVVGLVVGGLLHIIWIGLAWEARWFRARLAHKRVGSSQPDSHCVDEDSSG